ncbi:MULTISPECIES: carbohydrate kinase [unclassified Pseudoalteromonas]|uniref:carbohydrate kinase family protein n=1 Tax=unclassified Pseudoalteromonas TaxID=194690 RepID=UPI000731759B|nr:MULTISPECIES: carbohydrate kinase [unclassified Pseudoalteromonas]KTD95889.1 carbohydrate kinase [Pseudoalteromonas sp. H71]TMN79454.1 carbohydrate kinase [Pseudoalteromonas sp. S410]TMN90650.1 carbohydrate kinase [Pseudoalteromonas sp. S408]TMN95225.1 carbohydrate kinase [Pseudoalteromonas sp. S407]TMN98358.1 carbohydrate kinase [Pseudoalteromonas sp. S409]
MSILIDSKQGKDVSVSCFGEVLWDCFATGKRLGGAPLNMCVRINSLGIKADMISAVGNDELGTELLSKIKSKGVSCDYIAVNKDKKTSTVQVTLDKSGSASYEIEADTAWDNIELTDSLIEKVQASDVFVFGSLIGRSEASLATLNQLVDVANFKVFDVNLRAPHYTLNTLVDLMNKADFIKLNDEELYEIAKAMGCKFHSLEQNLAFIAEQTNTEYLCVTKGSHGALLTIKGENYYNSGYLISVVDTVGAGDSFLGSLIYQLCSSDCAQHAVDFACAVGAMVAESAGATPTLTHQQINEFMRPL